MKNCKKCSSNKKSNGCNGLVDNNNNSALNQCNQYKQLAQQKCEQAENINYKANKIAQQAVAAEQQAEALKRQAQQQCQNANDLWDQYNELARQGMCLMQQAQDCLAKSAECYADLYSEEEGCNLDDYGTNTAANNVADNGNTNQDQNYVSWDVLNAWQKSMKHNHGCNNCGCGHGCNKCGCN